MANTRWVPWNVLIGVVKKEGIERCCRLFSNAFRKISVSVIIGIRLGTNDYIGNLLKSFWIYSVLGRVLERAFITSFTNSIWVKRKSILSLIDRASIRYSLIIIWR